MKSSSSGGTSGKDLPPTDCEVLLRFDELEAEPEVIVLKSRVIRGQPTEVSQPPSQPAKSAVFLSPELGFHICLDDGEEISYVDPPPVKEERETSE